MGDRLTDWLASKVRINWPRSLTRPWPGYTFLDALDLYKQRIGEALNQPNPLFVRLEKFRG